MINQEVQDFHPVESEDKAEEVDKVEDLEAEAVVTKTYLTICKAYTIQKV